MDPWGATSLDYDKVVNQFGIKQFSDVLNNIKNPHLLMKRGIIFGHRDFDKIAKIISEKKEFSVVTGMMPSGKMHIGHKMIVDQLNWYFKNGGKLSIAIADMESYAARGIPFDEAREIAINEYLVNYIALGLDLTNDNINVYLQSKNEILKDLAFTLSKKVNFSEMRAIYGFENGTNIAHLYVPIVQVADILLPQSEELGMPKTTIVPVGLDQDPHIRLTRDIAIRFKEELKFVTPASTYHRFITGLTGGKMSSSKPKTAIFLNDSPELAEKKVKTSKTGGRESLDEQKKLGGCPDKCVIYEMLVYHLMDNDSDLKKVYDDCKSGILLCGDCKAMTASMMKEMFEKIAIKRDNAIEIANNLL
ncbi:tryptophan--tRNA ligase [Methanobrevibacter filiformis]|uniref:Tryptophan--tRNA ligase n=1 Tax=Methanobrevibacter filiformis TaxID=55758 RepID=A0A166ET72_9EURY|nr:tryptophan--tRNA ligase [Methanobrevibacter filiformis]KZX16986.1 tryptophan--tRNA ligase [Methanobrevibacter filiformis]